MSKPMITALPLGEADRAVCLECANKRFDSVLARMEPDHPDIVRRLWSAETYIDTVLGADKLHIDRDYALGLIEAFLVGHVADLAAQADALAGSTIH